VPTLDSAYFPGAADADHFLQRNFTMTDRIQRGGLRIAPVLCQLLEDEIAPGTGISPEQFWQALEAIVDSLAPRNRELLQIRDELQSRIDDWHRANPGASYDRAAYKAFLARERLPATRRRRLRHRHRQCG